MPRKYKLIEANLSSIPPEITNKKIEIDWPTIEHNLGANISPDVRRKYETLCSGKSFKVMTYLSLFSRLGNVAHLFFIGKLAIEKELSRLSFAIWAGVIAVQSISYLYNDWFVTKNDLHDIDRETGEEIVNESDSNPKPSPKIDLPSARKKLSFLWSTNESSSSKGKWLIAVVLIMIAALLGTYTHGIITESKYIKQRRKIKLILEQDSNQNSQSQLSNIPDAEQILKMSPDQIQKTAQNFMDSNNIKDNKDFANVIKSAVSQDMDRNKAVIQDMKEKNPNEYNQLYQQARTNPNKGFFDTATSRYKSSLSPMSLLGSIAFAVILGKGSPAGILNYMLTFTFPSVMIGGWGTFGTVAFSIARMMAGRVDKETGELTKVGSFGNAASKYLTYLGIALACCCAIRWLYKFLLNPKKNAKAPVVDKAAIGKELGGDIIAGNIPKGATAQQTESYIYENLMFLDEGVISYIKDKVINFFKGTYRCLKAIIASPLIHKGFKVVVSVLALGFMLGASCLGIKAIVTS